MRIMPGVTPILNPFDDERVVGLSPVPAAQVEDWNRRLNLFTGRALSDRALTAEQNGKAGRLALCGQMVSPGVVAGLEVGLENDGENFLVHIAPGFGLAPTGEDVAVSKLTRVGVRDLPVYTAAALLDGTSAPTPPSIGLPPASAMPVTGALAARALGPSLDALIKKNVALPRAGFLVLQPVMTEFIGAFDESDPCEQDPQNDAFDDAQLLDGCRLIYYAWPTEWLPLPPAGDRWRNRMAYAVFEREASAGPNDLLPWEEVGLPIGLIAFDDTWKPVFVDRYTAVRGGGKPKRRTPLVPNTGNPFLWQARIQQFAGHVISLNPAQTAPEELAKEFRYLPPAGLLPKSALTLVAGTPGKPWRVSGAKFFPADWSIEAVPIPTEQLDLAVHASASLEPFDTLSPDQVKVLVPVPQVWYEPDLLQVMQVDPAFQKTVDEFAHQRALWLKRRQGVRGKYSTLVTAVNGTPPVFPDPDPNAVESEEVAGTEIDPNIDAFKNPEEAYDTIGAGPQAAGPFSAVPPSATALDDLKKKLEQLPGAGAEEDLKKLGVAPPAGQKGVGLADFIAELERKVKEANDKIDFAFAAVQTNIYRTRQTILGSHAATRLATSPALADIAKGESALATRDELAKFLEGLKQKVSPPSPPRPTPPPSRGPGVPPAFFGPRLFLPGFHIAPPPPSRFFGGGISIGPMGFLAAPRTPATATLRSVTSVGATHLFTGLGARTADVRQQRFIVGAGYGLRTASVAERLQDPVSTTTHQFAYATKYEVISTFKSLSQPPAGQPGGIKLDDIFIPGFRDEAGHEIQKPFGKIDDADLGALLNGHHDKPGGEDEAAFFSAGVRSMENTIEILRLIEGRVHAYEVAIEECCAAESAINHSANSGHARLTTIESELGKARHDVAFARALLAEETARVARINQRRDQIVAEHVKFLAFVRPRAAEALASLPARPLNPGLAESPIPACLARSIAAPQELRAMVNLLREAPLKWFVHIPILLHRLDGLDVLHTAVAHSKLRAGFKLFQAPEPDPHTTHGPLGPHILNVFTARKQTVMNHRLATSKLDLTEFAGHTWEHSRARAAEVLSLGDLIDLGHYHPQIPRVSAAEIENIQKIAACLYSDFSGVLPVIRLNWAERMTQIDGPVNLSNLASLPRWAEVPYLDRKEMQAMVDWLFSRVVITESDAVAHINDLVRLCILLASHAPVSDIIAGSVIHPTPIFVGGRVHLTADLSRVRVGMHVLMYHDNQTVARGVVENLAAGHATARVLTTASNNIHLDTSSKVHFAATDAFERNPFTAGRLL